MIDFHSHILPGMDDGSKNTDMSIEMLKMMKKSGVTIVVATPHFYGERESMDSFLKRRSVCKEHLDRKYTSDLPKVLLGAEVAFFEGISRASHLEQLCIDQTKLLLLEMPFCHWDEKIYKEVKVLSKKQEFHLILAHIERYASFQKRNSYFDEVLQLDVTCQCNSGPLTSWTKRGLVLKYFKEGIASILGSDCHNVDSRKPNLKEGRDVLEKKFGKEFLNELDEKSQSIIQKYSV